MRIFYSDKSRLVDWDGAHVRQIAYRHVPVGVFVKHGDNLSPQFEELGQVVEDGKKANRDHERTG